MLWMMFKIILMITIQIETEIFFFFDDMIADIYINEKFQTIVK